MKHIAEKRLITGVLALLLLSLSSCTKAPLDIPEAEDVPQTEIQIQDEAESQKPSEEEKEQTAFDLLPKEDFGGREFVIATTDEAFTDSAENSGIIGKAIYKRNRAIEEKFNIKIKTVPVQDYLLQTHLRNAQNEGTPIYDLIYAPMDTISSCGAGGLLMNIYSVPFFGVDEEYAQSELISSLSQNYTTYGVYGDAAYDDRSMWCVYYNKDILSFLGYPDPYSMVKDGTWTWETFLDIANKAVSDLDGNKRMSKDTDRYGYSSSMNTSSFAGAVFASFGKTFFSRDDEGYFTMNFAETEEDKYTSLLRRICVTDKAKYPMVDPGAEALEAFSQNRLAFFCERLSYASSLAYIPANWGILPMPKKDASQEGYYTLADGTTHGYALPQKIADSSLSGKVLDALYLYDFCYGKKENTVQLAFTYYYLRDNDSAAVLSLMEKGTVYDAAYAFGAGMPDFSMVSYGLLRSCLENNVNFSHLYNQNAKPFSAFVRQKFVH